MDHLTEYKKWLESPFLSPAEKAELSALTSEEIRERFCRGLSFGTAGLRGIAETGLSRLNVFTLSRAVRALADKLKGGLVVICRDARLSSEELARACACVLCERGFSVIYFKDPRPTPELAFAVPYYKADAGVNVTASHNPKEYNGCKFYKKSGAQMGKEDTEEISALSEKYPLLAPRPDGFEEYLKRGRIKYADCDEAYISRVLSRRLDRTLLETTPLKVAYTAFCGVGGSALPEVFRRAGFKNLFCEAHELIPDGDFPGLSSPNPENDGGFKRAEKLCRKTGADLIIATDPDADRMSAEIPFENGFLHLTGNQIGALLVHYIIKTRKRLGLMPPRPFVVKTIVTTPLIDRICEKEGVFCHSTFTGFKNIAERLERENPDDCVFCFEESIGYMTDPYVRDKDGVSAALLLCEAAAYHLSRGKTLKDALDGIYEEYGDFREKTLNVYFEGADGAKIMAEIMSALREKPPKELCGDAVTSFRDYLTGKNTQISGENVLEADLASGGRVLIRPSGTEPKIKIYAHAEGADPAALAEALKNYAEGGTKNG
ncbi:MAG: phospho-sugar mutase [Clostridia bacterium]|nr:phospho-sugar mutase [Clostridia bacterium]